MNNNLEKTILVTGATGYLGKALCNHLLGLGYAVRVVVRSKESVWPEHVSVFYLDGIESDTDWSNALENVSTVIHCAARVHVMKDKSNSSIDEFRKVNTLATVNLANQAAEKNVGRFIFISSIGVNGTETIGRPFHADDIPNPESPYAISKFEAEKALINISITTGMNYVIIRPPLIYGPNAPGNFSKLVQAIKYHYPLPLGKVVNLRSFVALDNVVDLISRCINHHKAINQIFLVSDDEDISITDFTRKIAKANGKAALILPIPESCINWFANLIGKQQQIRKLTSSLQLNVEKTKLLLSWKPAISVDEAIIKSAQHNKYNLK